MKNLIKLMFLTVPMIFVNIWSMSDRSLTEKEIVVEEKEKAKQDRRQVLQKQLDQLNSEMNKLGGAS